MSIQDYVSIRMKCKSHFEYYGKRYVFNGFVSSGDYVISIYGRCCQDKTEIEIPAERFTDMVNRRI